MLFCLLRLIGWLKYAGKLENGTEVYSTKPVDTAGSSQRCIAFQDGDFISASGRTRINGGYVELRTSKGVTRFAQSTISIG